MVLADAYKFFLIDMKMLKVCNLNVNAMIKLTFTLLYKLLHNIRKVKFLYLICSETSLSGAYSDILTILANSLALIPVG